MAEESVITSEEVSAALAPFVGAKTADTFITSCANEALELVNQYAGTAAAHVPDSVYLRACVEVGADLYHRRAARNGVAGFEDADISPAPVRINRDPMVPARPILAPFLGVGIA